jgi:hypothetical protein
MRVQVPRLIILPLLLAIEWPLAAGEPPAPADAPKTPSTEKILHSYRTRFENVFDRHLKDPAAYRKRAADKCAAFPEGDLFPFTFPALAYVNLALAEPDRKAHYAAQARKLVDLAIESVTKRVSPPGGKLENLPNYRTYATHLGQLNLVLGAYRLACDDTRYDRLHDKLTDLFLQALEEKKGLPLRSYPTYSWPMDTIPVLVSLKLHDIRTGGNRSGKPIAAHLAWVRERASHPDLKLPYSRFNDGENRPLEAPRGCDLSLRLCLLPHIDRDGAKQMYDHYVRSFWIAREALAGFAEWPHGKVETEDIDSGPIFMGVGLAATGMGIGATKAMGDAPRLRKLCIQLTCVNLLRAMYFASQAMETQGDNRWKRMLDPEHYTGLLMGDAVLFYCITWHPWSAANRK